MEEDIMIGKIIGALRQAGSEQEATGTFADGAFALTTGNQFAFDNSNSLRKSYGRDTVAGSKLHQAASLVS
jgi:hypothetical protein